MERRILQVYKKSQKEGRDAHLIRKEIAQMYERWKMELNNILFYLDKRINEPEREWQLFEENLDPLEAGEILIKEFGK